MTRVLWITGVLLALPGCPASNEDVQPPRDQIYFPTGLAAAPDESVLFVANANSDLRYGSGSISVVDLSRVDRIFEDWLASAESPSERDCEVDLVIPYTLVCNEKEVLAVDGGVRIGNFATEIDTQILDDGSVRLFAAVRGDPSLTWADYDAEARELVCGGSGQFPKCDEDHRLVQLLDDAIYGEIPDEPFGLFADSGNGYVVVTHLTRGAVSLADAPTDGSAPVLADAIGGVFEPDPSNGVRSAVGAAGRIPGSERDRVYVTSRSEARVQVFTVARPHGVPTLVPGEYFFLRGVTPSDDARGIAFSDDGDRAYVVNRNPPMLHILDTSLDEGGVPKNTLHRAVELCSEAANLAVAQTGVGERIFVSCFRHGQVWGINPELGTLDAIIDVGRGPQALVALPGREKLYVSNYLEDTIAVVDLRAGSSFRNRVVLKLGRTRQSGGE